jgi:hypothetical protein
LINLTPELSNYLLRADSYASMSSWETHQMLIVAAIHILQYYTPIAIHEGNAHLLRCHERIVPAVRG